MSTTNGDGADADTARTSWKELAWVLLLALLVQWNLLSNRPVYDDLVLTENPVLRSPWSWPGCWGTTWWGSAKPGNEIYRPLASWSLALNGWANERVGLPFLSVTGFHVTNALFHAAASALALLFLRALGLARGAAFVAAQLFAVLAIHVEALAPITGRPETMALAFGLLYLLLHLRRAPPWTAGLALLAAVACKESAVGFFPFALLLDVARKRERPSPVRHGFGALAIAVFLLARAHAIRGQAAPVYFVDNPLVAASTLERVLTACAVQLDYLRLMLVPHGFRSDASYDALAIARSPGDARVLLFALVLAGACTWAWLRRARDPAVALALAGFALLSVLTSNLFFVIGTPRAERLAYAPSLFVVALAGIALAGIPGRFRLVRNGIAGLALLANLLAAWQRNAVWRDPGTFFRAQVAESPRSAKAHYNLGAHLAAQGDDRAAEEEYRHALAIHAGYHDALYNLANVFRRRAEPERALECYREALESAPSFLPAAFGTVGALQELGRSGEARALLDDIARKAPGHPWLSAHRKALERTR